MNILGISAYYLESTCCLLQDGALIAAVEEEHFSRIKHDAALPVRAFRFCLERGGIGVTDVDRIAFYEKSVAKLACQLWSGTHILSELPWLDARSLQVPIEKVLLEKVQWLRSQVDPGIYVQISTGRAGALCREPLKASYDGSLTFTMRGARCSCARPSRLCS